MTNLQDLLRQLADTVSKGGNLLVDVGPTKEGTIPLIMQDRLQAMGKWLNVNGEAVSRFLTLLYIESVRFFIYCKA